MLDEAAEESFVVQLSIIITTGNVTFSDKSLTAPMYNT